VRKQPQQWDVIRYSVALLAVPCIAMVLSVSLASARLFCDVNIDKFSTASYHERVSILSYWLCFTFFLYLCAFADIIFLYIINRHLKELDTSLSANRSVSTTSSVSIGDSRKNQMSNFVNRLRCYPVVFVIGWIPDSLSLLDILITGRPAITLRLFANAFAGSTGWAMALTYFYYQFSQSGVREDSTSGRPSGGAATTSSTSSPLIVATLKANQDKSGKGRSTVESANSEGGEQGVGNKSSSGSGVVRDEESGLTEEEEGADAARPSSSDVKETSSATTEARRSEGSARQSFAIETQNKDIIK
jgi:hypothetical protein